MKIVKMLLVAMLALALAASVNAAEKKGKGKGKKKAAAEAIAAKPAAGQAQIKLGICTKIEEAEAMAKIGYQYVEVSLSSIAKMSDEEFAKYKEKALAGPIKPESANGFMGSPLTVVGPTADLKPIEEYMKKAFPRANELGIKILVYGSAGTRKLPDGWAKEKAIEQLVAFLQLASDCAKPYPGLTIIVEPLRPQESNFINTIEEGLDVVKKADRPNVRAFGDIYHMGVQNEPMDAIYEGGAEWFKHFHIARVDGRAWPKAGDSSMEYYQKAFKAMRDIGYVGRVSIEGKGSVKEDGAASYEVLRALADGK